MNILTFETTGKYASAAVIKEDSSIYVSSSANEMNHLRDVTGLADDAVKKAGIDKKDLTHAAASSGPGSFTGIRIGVTAARTVSQMLGIPCISISSLEAMAHRNAENAVSCGALYIAPIINARRHQTYAGIWQVNFTSGFESVTLIPAAEERQYMIEELLDLIKQMTDGEGITYFTGDGIDAYDEIISSALGEGQYVFAPEELRYQDAGAAAEIAMRKALLGETISYDELLPEYMRLSEAEQRLKDGTLSDKIKNAGKRI